jgi:hypothetical protein
MSCSGSQVIPQLTKFASLGAGLTDLTALVTTPPASTATVMVWCDVAAVLELRWSMNGADVDFIDTINIAAGTAESSVQPLRAEYVAVAFTPTAAANFRYQTVFS